MQCMNWKKEKKSCLDIVAKNRNHFYIKYISSLNRENSMMHVIRFILLYNYIYISKGGILLHAHIIHDGDIFLYKLISCEKIQIVLQSMKYLSEWSTICIFKSIIALLNAPRNYLHIGKMSKLQYFFFLSSEQILCLTKFKKDFCTNPWHYKRAFRFLLHFVPNQLSSFDKIGILWYCSLIERTIIFRNFNIWIESNNWNLDIRFVLWHKLVKSFLIKSLI